jgi:hypothetical protein
VAKADQPSKAKGERARAVKRLHEVVIERRQLRTADEQVAAPKRRLKSVDKQDAKP